MLNNMEQLEKENFYLTYYRAHNMMAVGANIIVFGMEQFKRVNVLRRKAEIESWIENDTVQEHIMNGEAQGLAFEEIIDTVKISICFENYMKGVLLSKGFVVNELNKDTLEVETLSRAQRKRPVHIDEVLQSVQWEKSGDPFYTLKGLKRNTLNFSTMLSENYQKEIGLPPDILKIIAAYNDKRNNLHFYQNSEFQISKEVTERIGRLNSYVDEHMIPFFHSLNAELEKSNPQ